MPPSHLLLRPRPPPSSAAWMPATMMHGPLGQQGHMKLGSPHLIMALNQTGLAATGRPCTEEPPQAQQQAVPLTCRQ